MIRNGMIKASWKVDGVAKRMREYNCLACIKARCNNPNNPKYHYYGGRGIKCLYKNFTEFLDDIGMSPSDLHTVDRIDSNGHYEVGNCRWVTRSEQMRNIRTNITVTHNGETKILKDWAKDSGINYRTMIKRYHSNRDLFAPIQKMYRNTGNTKRI